MKRYVLIGIMLVATTWLLYSIREVEPVVNASNFDHSVCQYPHRTTNPPNGCDNSDPCDTLNAVKGGSGECSDHPSRQETKSKGTEPKPVVVNRCQ